MNETREEREAKLHDKFFAEGTRSSLERVYGMERASRTYFVDWLAKHVAGKDALEYGCGTGEMSVQLARAGARVSGIDISPEAIRQGAARAVAAGVKADFQVMDAQALTFPDASFDVVYGRAILHHLHLARSMEQITRVLRPDGTAIFLEPLGHNPAIEFFRKLTPGIRTPDERPLLQKDLNLMGAFFERAETRYFHLASLAALPFTRLPGFRPVYRALERLDDVLFDRVSFLRRHAWTAVLVLHGPRAVGRPAAVRRTIPAATEERHAHSADGGNPDPGVG